MKTEEPEENELSDLDRSLFFALCAPLTRLAVRRGISLRALKHLLGMAYFRETRRQGLTGPVAAERMGVSLRTVTQLSRDLKDLLTIENRHGLPRQLEYLLWAEPISEARMKQTVRADPQDIDAALKLLVEQNRVRLREDGRYEVTREQFKLVNEQMDARIDGMQNQLEAVADTIVARFHEGAGDDIALARTYNIKIRRRDTHLMRDLLYPHLRNIIDIIEHAALVDRTDLVDMALTLTWSEHKMVNRIEEAQKIA